MSPFRPRAKLFSLERMCLAFSFSSACTSGCSNEPDALPGLCRADWERVRVSLEWDSLVSAFSRLQSYPKYILSFECLHSLYPIHQTRILQRLSYISTEGFVFFTYLHRRLPAVRKLSGEQFSEFPCPSALLFRIACSVSLVPIHQNRCNIYRQFSSFHQTRHDYFQCFLLASFDCWLCP